MGAVSPRHQGRNLKEALGDASLDLKISGSVAEALATPTDVLVDYTKAEVVKANVMTAIRKGVHVVIGSSGLTDEDFIEINQAALEHEVGVIAAGNFAMTAMLLQRFACEAAKYLSHWEIIDYASDDKVDAPSGTTRELAFRLSEIRKPEVTHASFRRQLSTRLLQTGWQAEPGRRSLQHWSAWLFRQRPNRS